MGSLLEEYRRRHGITCVWPVNEGTLFFERNNRPELICITSSHSKAHAVCPACPVNRGGITLEIFRRGSSRGCCRRVAHVHMPPDGDLLHYVERHVRGGSGYSPVIIHTERELERWTWEFFLQTHPFKGDAKLRFQALLEDQKRTGEDERTSWITQMVWTMRSFPSHFRNYYLHVYSICLVNRTYILME